MNLVHLSFKLSKEFLPKTMIAHQFPVCLTIAHNEFPRLSIKCNSSVGVVQVQRQVGMQGMHALTTMMTLQITPNFYQRYLDRARLVKTKVTDNESKYDGKTYSLDRVM